MGATSPRTADSANVFETVGMIDQGTFDIGHPVAREQLAQFALAAPEMADGIQALLDVAVKQVTVSMNEVAQTLEAP